MENKVSKDVILLGKVEVAISSFLLAISLIMIISDLTFHLAGGFLAVIGIGVGLAALIGLVAGIATLKLKYLGALINLILARYIIYFELPVVKTDLSDLAMNRALGSTYPVWHFVGALIFLSIAAFLVFFFLRMIFKSIFPSK